MNSYFAPLGRLLLSIIFILSGVNKIFQYQGVQQYMASKGVPGDLLPIVIGFEIIVPLALVLGLYARSSAFLMAGFTLLAAALFHNNFSEMTEMIMFMKNIAITGGLLMIVANGPGPFSITK